MFSVIIPNYNHARFLEKRLNSVLNQSFSEFEIIILDDNSSDNSREIIEKYEDRRISQIIFNKKNSGSPFRQWKKGIELAKNKYVWIAESDDWCEPNFLQEAADALFKHPLTTVYYADSHLVGENEEPFYNTLQIYTQNLDGELWNRSHHQNGKEYVQKFLKKKNVILNASSAVFTKAAALKHIDKILDFKTSGDWLFWILLLSEGDVFLIIKN